MDVRSGTRMVPMGGTGNSVAGSQGLGSNCGEVRPHPVGFVSPTLWTLVHSCLPFLSLSRV